MRTAPRNPPSRGSPLRRRADLSRHRFITAIEREMCAKGLSDVRRRWEGLGRGQRFGAAQGPLAPSGMLKRPAMASFSSVCKEQEVRDGCDVRKSISFRSSGVDSSVSPHILLFSCSTIPSPEYQSPSTRSSSPHASFQGFVSGDSRLVSPVHASRMGRTARARSAL